MTLANSRYHERLLIEEAVSQRTIDKRLGDELIDAAREAVAAYHARGQHQPRRLHQAIRRLEQLVGGRV